jgi:dTMP kinase
MNKGYFITFEGGEGAGKTTLIEKISSHLTTLRRSFIKTREPGGTKLGEEMRKLLLNFSEEKMSPYTELCLFLAARAEHIKEVILPALNEGKIVLCDRFNDSTVAYQGCGRDLGMEKVKHFCSFISQDLKPRLTIYLNIDPEIALPRAKKNLATFEKGYDRIESEALFFHKKIREAFLILAKNEPERFLVIDASLSKEEVFRISMKAIERLI